jgi:ABC-type Fe3+-hydroxamate transport system substrate-binding protein
MTDSSRYQFNLGRPVGFIPQRVVSLVPSITESLFDLNLGARVVGVTDYCTRPAESVARLPKVGGTKNPDLEKILALHADLVMMNSEENRLEDAEAITGAGIAVWASQPNTVLEAFNLLWSIMDTFEEPKMVPRVRLIENQYDWVWGMTKSTTPRRVFAPIWKDPYMTFNAHTFAHDLLRVCGGVNTFADRDRLYPLAADLGQQSPLPADDRRVQGRDTRYPRLSLEEIIAAQPEVILLPNEPYLFTESDVQFFRTLDIPAAKTGEIHLIDGSLLTWHGTRIAFALQDLPTLINAKPDPLLNEETPR